MNSEAENLFQSALGLRQQGNWQATFDCLQHAIKIAPRCAKYHAESAAALFMLGRESESALAYEKALKLDPDDLNSLNNLAVIRSLNRKHQEAEALLQRSLAKNPRQLEAWLNLCSAVENMGSRQNDVVSYAQQAVALSPRDPRTHRYLSKALLRQGDPEGALRAMETALALEPRNPDAHYGIGIAHMELGNIPEAVQAFQVVLAIDSNHGKTYYALADLLYRLDDLPAAEEACRLAEASLDDKISPAFLLAKILFASGRLDEAKATYDQYRKLYHQHRTQVLGQRYPGGQALLLPVEGVDAWCERNQQPVLETIPQRTQPSARLVRYGYTYQDSIHPACIAPHAYVAEIKNAVVLPGHELILVDNEQTLLYDRLVGLQDRNNLMEDDVVRLSAPTHALADVGPKADNVLKEGIFLLDQFWYNYAHWLLEQLPRLRSIESSPEYRQMPLLVNTKLYPQQLESLHLVNQGRHPVIELPIGKRVEVKRLVYASNLTASMLMRYRPDAPATPMDVSLHPEAVTFLRERLLPQCAPRPGGGKRLWVSRKAKNNIGHRRLINEGEIEALFRERGFEVVVPETLTFRQQVSVFAEAEMIAGCAGAGMINSIFAPSDARILMFTKNHPQVNFHYFTNIANVIGQPIAYVCGEPLKNFGVYGFEADFNIDINVARQAMRDFLGL